MAGTASGTGVAGESIEMSGDGVVSVRLTRSLYETFQAITAQQGSTIHSAARRVIVALPSLTLNDLRGLREQPREIDMPRVSLYVGWRCVEILTAYTHDFPLSLSTIFRRVLFGLLICKTVEFVQNDEKSDFKLRLTFTHNNSRE
jgi:hypothetical protein